MSFSWLPQWPEGAILSSFSWSEHRRAGQFHPKLYLFFNDDDSWELVVGSGNFTNQAFTTNTEAVVLISSDDDKAPDILADARAFINECWKNGGHFTEAELDAYRKTWKNHRAKLKSLSGEYGSPINAKGMSLRLLKFNGGSVDDYAICRSS